MKKLIVLLTFGLVLVSCGKSAKETAEIKEQIIELEVEIFNIKTSMTSYETQKEIVELAEQRVTDMEKIWESVKDLDDSSMTKLETESQLIGTKNRVTTEKKRLASLQSTYDLALKQLTVKQELIDALKTE